MVDADLRDSRRHSIEGSQCHRFGNTKFEQKPLEEKLTLTNGLPFEQAKMQKDAQWLQELYGSQGYVFADVQPETIYLEEPGQVDLRYDIKEGDRFRVGHIFVHINGDNPHTRIQTALNRVTLRPGQIMDIRELKASERRLLASSLFHTDAQSGQRPKISYRIPDDAEIGMAERPTGNVRGQSPDVFGPPVLPPSARTCRCQRRRSSWTILSRRCSKAIWKFTTTATTKSISGVGKRPRRAGRCCSTVDARCRRAG